MEAGIPSQACKLKYLYNWRHRGLLPASCTVWSEWITANSYCAKGDYLHTCMFLFCSCTHTHTHTHTHTGVYIPTLSINSWGVGQRCPLDGDSPVRLHLARTHQQGHKVNKRQSLNLVLPDRMQKPKEEERVRINSDGRKRQVMLFLSFSGNIK